MSSSQLILRYKYKKTLILLVISYILFISTIYVRNDWSLSWFSDYLLLALILTIGIIPIFLLRTKLTLHKNTGVIIIQGMFKKHTFNIKDIKKIDFPRYEKFSGTSPFPFQVCEMRYDKKQALVQIPYRIFKKSLFNNFIEHIKEKRSDLGDFDKNIYKTAFI